MRRLTTLVLTLVLVGGVAGCGGSSSSTVVACKAGYVRSSFTKKCVLAGDPNFGETRSGEREHTPEEEAAHKKAAESLRRNHEQVEQDMERLGGNEALAKAHRETEKACYETGQTEGECNSPEHHLQERRQELENQARQQQSQEESTGQPSVVE